MNALCTTLVCGLAAGLATAQTGATFSPIVDPVTGGVAISANDMSPDGRWVVGGIDFNGDFAIDAGYRWDRQTNTFTIIEVDNLFFGADPVVAISDDGSTLLGSLPGVADALAEEAAIWTDAASARAAATGTNSPVTGRSRWACRGTAAAGAGSSGPPRTACSSSRTWAWAATVPRSCRGTVR